MKDSSTISNETITDSNGRAGEVVVQVDDSFLPVKVVRLDVAPYLCNIFLNRNW